MGKGKRCPIFKFLGFLVTARTVDTDRLQNHRSAGRLHSILASWWSWWSKQNATRLGQTGCWPKPVFRANHHFECRELTERMIITFVSGSNSVVRRLPQTLAHTRVGATVLYGDGTKLSRTRVSEQKCFLAVSRVGATVPHSGPQGCQSSARSSQCLQLAFRRNSVAWTSRSSAALCCSRLSRQVGALRIERSLNE